MTIKVSGLEPEDTLHRHANLGWQCPECYGVQVAPRMSRFQAQPIGFSCNECGCQWDRNYFPDED